MKSKSHALQYEQAAKDYEKAAAEWLAWTKGVTELMHDKGNPQDSATVRKLINELERFKNEDLPPMEEEKHRLFDLYSEIEEAFKGTEFWHVPNELKPEKLEEAWQELLKSMEFRSDMLKEQAGIQVIFIIFASEFPLACCTCPLSGPSTNVLISCLVFYPFEFKFKSNEQCHPYMLVTKDQIPCLALWSSRFYFLLSGLGFL